MTTNTRNPVKRFHKTCCYLDFYRKDSYSTLSDCQTLVNTAESFRFFRQCSSTKRQVSTNVQDKQSQSKENKITIKIILVYPVV